MIGFRHTIAIEPIDLFHIDEGRLIPLSHCSLELSIDRFDRSMVPVLRKRLNRKAMKNDVNSAYVLSIMHHRAYVVRQAHRFDFLLRSTLKIAVCASK